MKKTIIIAVVAVILIVAGVIFLPRLLHNCDECGKFFVGTGYKTNVVADFISSDDITICEDCAAAQHSISTSIGATLDDFKKPLFD